jgi:hypothetical protein
MPARSPDLPQNPNLLKVGYDNGSQQAMADALAEQAFKEGTEFGQILLRANGGPRSDQR